MYRSESPKFEQTRGKNPQMCPFAEFSCPFLVTPHACPFLILPQLTHKFFIHHLPKYP